MTTLFSFVRASEDKPHRCPKCWISVTPFTRWWRWHRCSKCGSRWWRGWHD